jgi:hypothetical protein
MQVIASKPRLLSVGQRESETSFDYQNATGKPLVQTRSHPLVIPPEALCRGRSVLTHTTTLRAVLGRGRTQVSGANCGRSPPRTLSPGSPDRSNSNHVVTSSLGLRLLARHHSPYNRRRVSGR